jgi:hypothetical protein
VCVGQPPRLISPLLGIAELSRHCVLMPGRNIDAMALWARACTYFIASKKDIWNLARLSARQLLMPDCKARIDLGNPQDMSPFPLEEVRRKRKEYNATRPVWTGKLGEPHL